MADFDPTTCPPEGLSLDPGPVPCPTPPLPTTTPATGPTPICYPDGTVVLAVAAATQPDNAPCPPVPGAPPAWVGYWTPDGAWNAGDPPSGWVPCGSSKDVELAGRVCVVDSVTGAYLGSLFVEATYDTAPTPPVFTGYVLAFLDGTTGVLQRPYVPGPTHRQEPCPSGGEVVVTMHECVAGECVEFLRWFSTTTHLITSQRTLDGTAAYSVTDPTKVRPGECVDEKVGVELLQDVAANGICTPFERIKLMNCAGEVRVVDVDLDGNPYTFAGTVSTDCPSPQRFAEFVHVCTGTTCTTYERIKTRNVDGTYTVEDLNLDGTPVAAPLTNVRAGECQPDSCFSTTERHIEFVHVCTGTVCTTYERVKTFDKATGLWTVTDLNLDGTPVATPLVNAQAGPCPPAVPLLEKAGYNDPAGAPTSVVQASKSITVQMMGLAANQVGVNAGPVDLSSQWGMPAGSVILTVTNANVNATPNWQTQSKATFGKIRFVLSGSAPVKVRMLHGAALPNNTGVDGLTANDSAAWTFIGHAEAPIVPSTVGNDYQVANTGVYPPAPTAPIKFQWESSTARDWSMWTNVGNSGLDIQLTPTLITPGSGGGCRPIEIVKRVNPCSGQILVSAFEMDGTPVANFDPAYVVDECQRPAIEQNPVNWTDAGQCIEGKAWYSIDSNKVVTLEGVTLLDGTAVVPIPMPLREGPCTAPQRFVEFVHVCDGFTCTTYERVKTVDVNGVWSVTDLNLDTTPANLAGLDVRAGACPQGGCCPAAGHPIAARTEILTGPTTYTYSPVGVALVQFDWRIENIGSTGAVSVAKNGDKTAYECCGVGESDVAECGLVPDYIIDVPAGAIVTVYVREAI